MVLEEYKRFLIVGLVNATAEYASSESLIALNEIRQLIEELGNLQSREIFCYNKKKNIKK